MAPKQKNDNNNGPPNQSDGNNNLPQSPDNKNDEPLRPPDNVRVTRSAAAKRGTPAPDEVEPPQPKRVKKGGKKGPPPKKFVIAEGMTRADINDTLENQRERLANALKRAEQSAEVGVAAGVTHATRMRLYLNRRNATAKYEDNLHFRVPEFRNQYAQHIDEDGGPVKKAFRNEAAPMLWNNSNGYADALWGTFESYERHKVGMTETINMPALGPRKLHLIVPAARRLAVGLGEADPPVAITPINLGLDLQAIERRRAGIEDNPAEGKNVAVDGSPMLETHTQRRARQMQPFHTQATQNNSSRRIFPTNLYVHNTIPTARNLDKTLLDTGVFISAGESSYNWNDSYDQTDIVKPGYLAVEEGMIAKIPPGERDVPPRSPSPEISDDERQTDEGVEGLLWEFARKKRDHKTYELVPTTTWAETTYGRREREHAYVDIRPPSPVLSPPHSPIFPVKTAANTFHVPADIPHNHPNFRDYRSKYKDKYSVGFQDWPSFKQAPEGRGKEVVYEPLDIAALNPNQQLRWDDGTPSLDHNGRFKLPAPEGTSMRLYREAFNIPYTPPIWADRNVEGEESDDEGDLFRQSYLACSGGQGGGSAT